MKRMVCIAVSLIVLTGLFSCKKEGFTPDQGKISQARISQKIKEYLEKAEGEDDDNLKARYLAAASELLADKGDFKKAVRIARRAKRANPSQKQALATIGEYYIYNGRYKEAQLVLSEALGADREYGRANYLMGNACFALNEISDARDFYKASIRSNPGDVRAHNNLAQIYLKQGNLGMALNVLKEGIVKAPQFALTYKNAGVVTEKMNNDTKALEYYQKYITLNPGGEDKEVVEQWITKLSK